MIKVKEASELLGIHPNTLRRWEKEGKIESIKTAGKHRRFTLDEINKAKNIECTNTEEKITIGYCRVCNKEQKEDLKRQIDWVTNYCIAKGYSFRIIDDLGSGLNYNKKGLKELIYLIEDNKIERIVIAYKDRLIRFGIELIEEICKIHNVKIEIVNQTDDKTHEEELVEDIISIITVFSSRLYGSRSYKQKKITEAIKTELKEGRD